MSLIMQIIIKLKQKRLIKKKENSRVPRIIPYQKVFKPSNVQDYILAIHFKFEIKIPLSRLREEQLWPSTVSFNFFLHSKLFIMGLNKINIKFENIFINKKNHHIS